MPKRRQENGFDVMAAIFARIPWWVPFALAAVCWFAVPPTGRAVVHQKAWDDLWPLIAGAGALVLALGGVVGHFEKVKRRRLMQVGRSLDALQSLGWREFEELCAEAYRKRGYAVAETARGADGGVDLVLSRRDERIFVQCKHYAARRVDVRRVRELYGVMAAERATGGILICSGSYTSAAHEFARGKNLELIDGPKLVELIESASPVHA